MVPRTAHAFGGLSIFALGLVASVVAAFYVRSADDERLLSEFNLAANHRMQLIESEVGLDVGILDSLQSFYSASETVRSDEFQEFAENERQRRNGVEAVEWLLRIAPLDRARYAAYCRRFGVAENTIQRRNDAGEFVPLAAASDVTCYPVLFVVTEDAAVDSVIGHDLASDAAMAAAIALAELANAPAATDAIVPAGGGAPRVCVVRPVKVKAEHESITDTPAAPLHGVVVARLNPSAIVASALAPVERLAIEITVFDTGRVSIPDADDAETATEAGNAPAAVAAVAAGSWTELDVHAGSSGDVLPPSSAPDFSRGRFISVADHRWLLLCRPTTDYLAQRSLLGAVLTFLAGALISILAAAYVRMLLRQRSKITQLVEQRTSELAERNAELRAEIELRESAEAELKRSNIELAQFAYVASHDLQEPLRMVASYCQLLDRKHGDSVGEMGRRYIHYAVDGAKRMQALISDLLEYSRINTREDRSQPVDLNAVVARAIANLAAAIEESNATIDVGQLGTVEGVEPHLLQLFQNLIGNAIKFRGDAVPQVRIRCEARDGQATFQVADNGIGIAPEHRERVFDVFKRLHGQGEFPGTGIGLAVCKKVVEHHGGRMWIESELGHGTTFLFTLSA